MSQNQTKSERNAKRPEGKTTAVFKYYIFGFNKCFSASTKVYNVAANVFFII